MIATPRTVAEVDRDWLARAIGVDIDDIIVEPIAAGAGFMGELARVHLLSNDPAAPSTVIVKVPTSDPGGRAIGESVRIWEREHCFYRDVAPRLNIRVPRALANEPNPPCLVLEDLAPAQPGDHVVGAIGDQAERAIDVLARHHAAWFEHPSLATFDWMPGLDDPAVLMLQPMFEIGWPMFLDRFASRVPERVLRWCERFSTGIPQWLAGHLHEPVTMVHGDFRLDNLFFLDDGAVAVIDWQMAMRSPGQSDLVYFCANNLTIDARRASESDLVDRYVERLHAAGVPSDAVTRSTVWQGYLEGLLFYATSFGASLLTIDPANERGTALFEQLVMRTFAAVDDHDVGTQLGLGTMK
jgi:hypothetical protein